MHFHTILWKFTSKISNRRVKIIKIDTTALLVHISLSGFFYMFVHIIVFVAYNHELLTFRIHRTLVTVLSNKIHKLNATYWRVLKSESFSIQMQHHLYSCTLISLHSNGALLLFVCSLQFNLLRTFFRFQFSFVNIYAWRNDIKNLC